MVNFSWFLWSLGLALVFPYLFFLCPLSMPPEKMSFILRVLSATADATE